MPQNDHPTANYYRQGAMKKLGGVVDGDLPEDEDSILTDDYDVAATFRAYIAGSRILQGGDVQLNVRVPYEDKYEALPITDLRGITFVMVVFRPLRRDEVKNGQGTGGGSDVEGHNAADDGGSDNSNGDKSDATILQFPGDPFALSTDD